MANKTIKLPSLRGATAGVKDKLLFLIMSETGIVFQVVCGSCQAVLMQIPLDGKVCQTCDTQGKLYDDMTPQPGAGEAKDDG